MDHSITQLHSFWNLTLWLIPCLEPTWLTGRFFLRTCNWKLCTAFMSRSAMPTEQIIGEDIHLMLGVQHRHWPTHPPTTKLLLTPSMQPQARPPTQYLRSQASMLTTRIAKSYRIQSATTWSLHRAATRQWLWRLGVLSHAMMWW